MRLLKIPEVAEVLGVHPATVARLVADGELQAVRVSTRGIRFEPAALQHFIDERRTGATPKRGEARR